MLPLAIAASLAAAPLQTVVVPFSATLAEPAATELASRVADLLARQGVTVLKTVPAANAALLGKTGRAASACAGKRECLAAAARALGVDPIVGVDAARVAEDLAVRIEVTAADGHRVAKESFVIPITAGDDVLAVQVAALLGKLEVAWAPKPEVPLAQTAPPPPLAPPRPAAASPPPPVVLAPAPAPSHAGIYVAGGASTAAGVVSLILVGLASSEASALNGSFSGCPTACRSTFTQTQAVASRDDANHLYTASAVAGGLAAGFAGVALYLLTRE